MSNTFLYETKEEALADVAEFTAKYEILLGDENCNGETLPVTRRLRREIIGLALELEIPTEMPAKYSVCVRDRTTGEVKLPVVLPDNVYELVLNTGGEANG